MHDVFLRLFSPTKAAVIIHTCSVILYACVSIGSVHVILHYISVQLHKQLVVLLNYKLNHEYIQIHNHSQVGQVASVAKAGTTAVAASMSVWLYHSREWQINLNR